MNWRDTYRISLPTGNRALYQLRPCGGSSVRHWENRAATAALRTLLIVPRVILLECRGYHQHPPKATISTRPTAFLDWVRNRKKIPSNTTPNRGDPPKARYKPQPSVIFRHYRIKRGRTIKSDLTLLQQVLEAPEDRCKIAANGEQCATTCNK